MYVWSSCKSACMAVNPYSFLLEMLCIYMYHIVYYNNMVALEITPKSNARSSEYNGVYLLYCDKSYRPVHDVHAYLVFATRFTTCMNRSIVISNYMH